MPESVSRSPSRARRPVPFVSRTILTRSACRPGLPGSRRRFPPRTSRRGQSRARGRASVPPRPAPAPQADPRARRSRPRRRPSPSPRRPPTGRGWGHRSRAVAPVWYDHSVDARRIRAYLNRDWAPAGASKRRYWARERRVRGARETLAASCALWEHVRTVRPDWPTPRDRKQDLEHHLAMKRLLDRTAHVFPAR